MVVAPRKFGRKKFLLPEESLQKRVPPTAPSNQREIKLTIQPKKKKKQSNK